MRFGVNRGLITKITDISNVEIANFASNQNLQSMILGGISTSTGTIMVPPSGSFSATPTSYTGGFSADMNTWDGVILTLIYYVLDEAAGHLPSPVLDILYEILFNGPNCALSLGSAIQSASDIGGFSVAVSALYTTVSCVLGFIDNVINDDPAAVQLIAELFNFDNNISIANLEASSALLGGLQKALLALKLAKYAVVVTDFFASLGVDDDVTYTYRPPAPQLPTVDSEGRDIVPDCVSQRFTFSDGWITTIDERCQDFAYGDYDPGPTPPSGPEAPIVNAWNDWNGDITSSLRLYNLLRRDASGQLHLILLEGGELVAHPISSADEWSFKQDWPEDEWRSAEFDSLIDRVGSAAVNDPLLLRNFTQGQGGNWLLREGSGRTWFVDGDGVRSIVTSVVTQQDLSNNYLTLHPAQYANDICPYYWEVDPPLKVC